MQLCLQARSRKCTYRSFFSCFHPAGGLNQAFRNLFDLCKSMGRKCELSVTSLVLFRLSWCSSLGQSTVAIISVPQGPSTPPSEI